MRKKHNVVLQGTPILESGMKQKVLCIGVAFLNPVTRLLGLWDEANSPWKQAWVYRILTPNPIGSGMKLIILLFFWIWDRTVGSFLFSSSTKCFKSFLPFSVRRPQYNHDAEKQPREISISLLCLKSIVKVSGRKLWVVLPVATRYFQCLGRSAGAAWKSMRPWVLPLAYAASHLQAFQAWSSSKSLSSAATWWKFPTQQCYRAASATLSPPPSSFSCFLFFLCLLHLEKFLLYFESMR